MHSCICTKWHYFKKIVWKSDKSWEPALWTQESQERVVMWSQKKHKWKVLSKKNHWCQKKSIAIFGYKQRLLSIDMKTKVVQHVPRINLSHFNFWILNLNFSIFNFSIFFWFPAFVWLSDIFLRLCLKYGFNLGN